MTSEDDDIAVCRIGSTFQWNGLTERGRKFLSSETSSADPTGVAIVATAESKRLHDEAIRQGLRVHANQ
jgi:hypothetical protein